MESNRTFAKYQLILLGHKSIDEKSLLEKLSRHVSDLGIEYDMVSIIRNDNISDYCPNAPTVILYWGQGQTTHPDIETIKNLKEYNHIILPVVSDLRNFNNEIPDILKEYNAFELKSKDKLENLASCILENLGLLRKERRLFISYHRNESENVAIQLYEELELAGFDVFLDTHKVRPGDIFQETLWHRMVDSDIVVLLNTKNFNDSSWTKKEFARANDMMVGIYQIVWPDSKVLDDSKISIQRELLGSDFSESGILNKLVIQPIISDIESIRARCYRARQDSLCSEFLKLMKIKAINAYYNPLYRIMFVTRNNIKYAIIPTIGIPKSIDYQRSQEDVDKLKKENIVKAYLLYDHRNIKEIWNNHLYWLNKYIPVETIKLTEIETWTNKIK